MKTKQLTQNQKVKWTTLIIKRDYADVQEPTCFFCNQIFLEGDPRWKKEWEHLNNNPEDNRPENLVWAHHFCNQKKKTDYDWQILADEKLQENIRWAESESESLGEGEELTDKETQPNEQIDANKEASRITEQYLIERLLSNGNHPPVETRLDYNDARDSITYLCYKKFGHGSQNTIDRILKMLTSKVSPFDRRKENGRLVIFQRTGN